MSDKKVKELLKTYDIHKKRKSQFDRLFEDVSRVHLPRRSGFIRTVIPGEHRMENIFDGTPMRAARGLGNNVGFFLRPENQEWLFMRIEDDKINNTDEAKFWLEDSRQRLMNAIMDPRARFRQATGEVDVDLVVFGTGLLFIGESNNLENLMYKSIHLKDATIVYSDEDRPEMMFIEWQPTLRQAIGKFGETANFATDTKQKIAQGQIDEKIKMVHAVVPRKTGTIDATLSKNLPIADMWIELEAEHLVQESGFHEFPFVAPRWDTTSGEDYGRSPAMIALPDSNTLQAMGETILVSGQRAADPPLLAPNDGSFSAVNTFPGGISYYDVESAVSVGGNPFYTLESGVNLPITRDMQVDTREQVLAAFFKNILNLPISGPQMTATEVIQRKDEFIREIGPVFGRFETDYTAPTVERSFNIMLRGGAFLPVPDILAGQNLTFQFESPITKIREQVKAAAVKLFAQETIELAATTGDVSILDNVNFDEVTRFNGESISLPNGVIRPEQEVAQLRAQRQKQEEEARKLAATEQMANIGDKVAGAVNKAGLTPTQGDSNV